MNSQTKHNKLLSSIVAILIITLPIVLSEKLIDPVLNPRQFFLGIACLALFISIIFLQKKNKIWIDSSLYKLNYFKIVFLFLIFIIISFLQATIVSESINYFFKYFILFLFQFLITILIYNKIVSKETIVKSVVFFTIIVILFAILQAIITYKTEKYFFSFIGNINSTNSHKNLFSSVLFLSTPFLLLSMKYSKVWKVISWLIIVLLIVLVWIVQTKSVLLAFLVSIICFFFLYLVFNKSKNYKRIIIPIISVGTLIIILTTVSIHNKKYFTHLTKSNSVYVRKSLWENTTGMINDNFFFGTGAGNWKIEFPSYGIDKFDFDKKIIDAEILFKRPHNDFLWIFSELGIFGFALYILIFAIVLVYNYLVIIKKQDWKEKFKYIIIFCSIVGYMFISSVDFPYERIEHQVLLLILFAFVITEYYQLKSNKFKNNSGLKHPVLNIFVLGLTISAIIVSWFRISGEYHSKKIADARVIHDNKTVLSEANLAINPFFKIDPASIPVEWYKGVVYFTEKQYKKAVQSFESAYKIHPNNINVLNNLASSYEKLQMHDKAVDFYLKTLKISPKFEEAILNLSAVYYNKGELSKAFETIDRCSISCKDPKYLTFLTSIIKSYLKSLNFNHTNVKLNKNIISLTKDKEKMLIVYFESKKNNANFTEYLKFYEQNF